MIPHFVYNYPAVIETEAKTDPSAEPKQAQNDACTAVRTYDTYPSLTTKNSVGAQVHHQSVPGTG